MVAYWFDSLYKVTLCSVSKQQGRHQSLERMNIRKKGNLCRLTSIICFYILKDVTIENTVFLHWHAGKHCTPALPGVLLWSCKNAVDACSAELLQKSVSVAEREVKSVTLITSGGKKNNNIKLHIVSLPHSFVHVFPDKVICFTNAVLIC